MPRRIGTSSTKCCVVSIISPLTPASAIFSGKCSNADLQRPGCISLAECSTTSKPCGFAKGATPLATDPNGYSFSQKGTKFKFAARTMGSASGRPINTTSFPRDCSLRASAVMGFRCPVTGTLTKPNFILALPAGHLDGPRHLAKATVHGLLHHEPVFCYKEHAWSSFIPG